jgi:hypothetical protein
MLSVTDGSHAPPPGSIVVSTPNPSIIAALAELTIVVMEWPWVIPCVAVPSGEEILDGRLMMIPELRDRLAIVNVPSVGGPERISTVLQAVRLRDAPSAAVLARWIAKRLRVSDLEPLLVAQFCEALDGIPATHGASVSTFCRYFARFGVYTARDWRALARFCVHVSEPDAVGNRMHVRLSSRMVADYAKRYLGIAPRQIHQRVGWEWLAESALRFATYV